MKQSNHQDTPTRLKAEEELGLIKSKRNEEIRNYRSQIENRVAKLEAEKSEIQSKLTQARTKSEAAHNIELERIDSERESLDQRFDTRRANLIEDYVEDKTARETNYLEDTEISGMTTVYTNYNPDDSEFCAVVLKNKDSEFLVLEWGHKIPRNFGQIAHQLDNLILLCARCNNQIQTSRKIEQLIPELEHKLQALKKLTV